MLLRKQRTVQEGNAEQHGQRHLAAAKHIEGAGNDVLYHLRWVGGKPLRQVCTGCGAFSSRLIKSCSPKGA